MVVNVDWFFISHRLPLAIKMKELGYQVYILSKDTGKKSFIEEQGFNFIDINFERSGKNPFNEIINILKLRKYFSLLKPTIIHNVTIKPAIYGSIAAKFSNLKNTTIINAISGLGYNFTEKRNGILQKLIKSLMKFAYGGDVKFIFQNKDDLSVYQQLGYVNNNFKIIKGAGVDANIYPYTPSQQKSKQIITLTARMLGDKGIREYVAAAKILQNDFQNIVQFQLVGDLDPGNPTGISREELESFITDDYIIWLGHHSNVIPLLQHSDIVCLPSYREGLPKSLIEAMAIGRPIVTTDVPGCRECVDHGINGYLVEVKNPEDLAKHLKILINDESLRIQMGKASRVKMEKELSLEKVLKETIEYYGIN